MTNGKRTLLITLTWLSLTFCNSANAITSGNDLHQWLIETKKASTNSIQNLFDAGRGLAYVVGIAESLQGDSLICLPSSVTSRQIVDIVYKFLDELPKARHLSASPMVKVALQEAFPCGGSK